MFNLRETCFTICIVFWPVIMQGDLSAYAEGETLRILVTPGNVKSGLAAKNRNILGEKIKQCFDGSGAKVFISGDLGLPLKVFIILHKNKLSVPQIADACRTLIVETSDSNASTFQMMVFDDPTIDSFSEDIETARSEDLVYKLNFTNRRSDEKQNSIEEKNK